MSELTGCSIHLKPWKLIPAGVSKKSGKEYPAFYTCSVYGCTEKPAKDYDPFGDAESPPLSEKEPLDKALMGFGAENAMADTDKAFQPSFPGKYEKPFSKIDPQESKPDWDAIAAGKVRHGVACAVISQLGLVELTDEMKELMDEWVEWIINK